MDHSDPLRMDSNARWKEFRIDVEALAGNLDATNRAIRENLEAKGERSDDR